MLKHVFRCFQKKEFFPFEDMSGVKQLILTKLQYYFLVERLNYGIEKKLEDGLVITVNKEKDVSRINDFYIIPNKFKTISSVDLSGVEESEWYKSLLSKLIEKQQKIGYYFHTHPELEIHGSNYHEEASTIRDIRFFPIIEKNMKPKEKKLFQARRRLGSIIMEKFKKGKVSLFGFTPAINAYYEGPLVHHRKVHSLEIIVPELNLKFKSYIH